MKSFLSDIFTSPELWLQDSKKLEGEPKQERKSLTFICALDSLTGDSHTLLMKMIQAMKIDQESFEVQTWFWNRSEATELSKHDLIEKFHHEPTDYALFFGGSLLELLTGKKLRPMDNHGKWEQSEDLDIEYMLSFHPEALIANGSLKAKAWDDLKNFRARVQK